MKKVLLVLVLLYGIYVLAWYRGVNHESINSTVVRGALEIQAVKSLRQSEVVDAINVLEKDLIRNYIRIEAFKGRVPKEFKEVTEKFLIESTEYFKEHEINPDSLNVE